MPVLTRTTRYSFKTDVAAVIVAANNLVQKSQELNNAAWGTKNNITITTDSNTSPPFDSTLTADRIVEAAGGPFAHFLLQASIPIVASTTYTLSTYVKQGSGGARQLRIELFSGSDGAQTGIFDPSTGTFAGAGSSFGSGVYTSQAVLDVGSGWYRISLTGQIPSTSASVDITLFNPGVSYVGDGTSHVVNWGWQLELGSSASNYVATL